MTQKEFKDWLHAYSYNVNDLYEIWYEPIKNFISQNIHRSFEGVALINILAMESGLKKKPLKDDMYTICARFYTNPVLLRAYFEALPEEDKQIIEKGVWSEAVGYKVLNDIYGRDVVYAKEARHLGTARTFYTLVKDKVLTRWSAFIREDDSWYQDNVMALLQNSNLRIEFPILFREVFSLVLPKPEGYYMQPISLPDDVATFNTEQTIFNEIPLILTYYSQDHLRYSMKGYPHLPSCRKMAKALQLADFPETGVPGLRSLMIAGLFTESFPQSLITKPPLAILRQLFHTNFYFHPAVPYLLPHLKGLSGLNHRDFNQDITPDLFGLFREMPEETWITFDNIKKYAIFHFIDIRPIPRYTLSKLSLHEDMQEQVSSINMRNSHYYVELPHLQGTIYLLAAFGLMEIAVKHNAQWDYSYYDGLYACRLTKLGAHILGMNNEEYTPIQAEKATTLTFDEHSLFIRIEGNGALAEVMLDSYATKVSENRYQFSPGKFLKDCKDQSNLEKKITLFKQTVGQPLPQFWNDYLQQLIENSKAIKPDLDSLVFQLPQDNKTLHRTIAQDPQLRSLIIKAEQYYILIKKRNVASFFNVMKELGYLVDEQPLLPAKK